MAFTTRLTRDVNSEQEAELNAEDNRLAGVKRPTDDTTAAIRHNLTQKQYPMSATVKAILRGRRWDMIMLVLEAAFVFGYGLLMVIWTPALGLFPDVIAGIAVIWFVGEIIVSICLWYQKRQQLKH